MDIENSSRAKVGQAINSFAPDMKTGLTEAEARKRLQEYGYNEVLEKKKNPLISFLRKFWGLSAWMIEAIIILSWILHKYSDLYTVTALLVINAILSFVQEQRASGAIESLRQKLQVNARVLRESIWKLVPARELAPGDIVRVRPGDFVPADVQILSGEIGVDQSALTGESMEAQKSPGDVLYSGSIVRRGEANGVVTLTGAKTYFGRTTQLVQIARPNLHIEGVISQVVRWLLAIVGVLLGIVVLFVLLRGLPLLDILPLLLVLLLGAVPVALPVMFTVSMAVGSMELARKGVLITRLSAAEDAATMDILCVDKTGTITMNKLSVAEVIPLSQYSEEDVLLHGYLASQQANHDPIDTAFISAIQQRGLDTHAFVQQSFSPFDPLTRRTEALIQGAEQSFRVAKGAVGVVAQACGLDEQAISALEARADEYARGGYRTLAVARSNGHETLELTGMVTLYDKPHSDSATFVAALQARGVAVKMLTGDALPIAREIAQNVGLGPNISKASELERLAQEDPNVAAALAETSSGFAEIYPEGKYTVVRALQARGHVVGMTGDGINDAPALRQAEVGIAVNNAADVAKGAASVVLTKESLSSIVDLVENGRKIYQRILIWVINKISRTILKSAFIAGVFLLTSKFAVSAQAMLLMVLMTDFVKIALSTDNVRGSQLPEKWDIAGPVKLAIILGALMVVEAFGLLQIGLHYLGLSIDDPALYTFSFLTLLSFAIFSILVIRERCHFWNSRPSWTLLLALGLDLAAGTAIAVIGIPGMAPLLPGQIVVVLAYALVFSLLVNDMIKSFLVKRVGLSW